MTTQYRPEGWENLVSSLRGVKTLTSSGISGIDAQSLLEAGADAMLEGLKKQGTKVEEGKPYHCPCSVCLNDEDCYAIENGYLVFIEEE